MKVKDMSVTEPGQTMFCICEKKRQRGQKHLRGAFNAAQCTGITQKGVYKAVRKSTRQNKCTGNYCCCIDQCIRYSGLCLRRRHGCNGWHWRHFIFFKSSFTVPTHCNKRCLPLSTSLCSPTCLCSVDTNSKLTCFPVVRQWLQQTRLPITR